MRRRWRSMLALGLAALIGCVLPAGTMLAAEEAPETELTEREEQAPEAEITEAEEQAPKTELTEAEEQAPETELTEAEEQAPEAEITETAEEVPETEIAEPEEEASEIVISELEDCAAIMPVAAETAQEESQETAPVIEIRLQGTNWAQALGGRIEYNTYIGHQGDRFHIAAENATALFYYLDTEAEASGESKSEEQLAELWVAAEQTTGQEISLGQDGGYVLYVKAESSHDQTVYARTDGVVVDTVAPVIDGIVDGGTYPAGTSFRVIEDNLDSVLLNEQAAVPSADGVYQVVAAPYSTSCVIRAKDKAGHETVCSITVEGQQTEDDMIVINESGVYTLQAGTAYRLGDGSWTLEGDTTVYRGGITFYVKADGSYSFHRN